MSNINTLRETLFDTLHKLKSGELDVDKARAINDVAQTIINSAKTEIEFMKVAGGSGTYAALPHGLRVSAFPRSNHRESNPRGFSLTHMQRKEYSMGGSGSQSTRTGSAARAADPTTEGSIHDG
jgi:hypothetical protein